MKKILLFGAIILVCMSFVNAQTRQTNIPDEFLGRDIPDEYKASREAKDRTLKKRMNELRSLTNPNTKRDRFKTGKVFFNDIRPLYRGFLLDFEKKILAPDEEYLQKYASFLNDKSTGIIKLLIDRGCDGGTELIIAQAKCGNLTMPGAGSSYSFRANRYSIKRLSDISFIGKYFDTNGQVKNSILVNMGDIPINNVNLKTKELEALVTFKPKPKVKEMEKFFEVMKGGVKAGDLIFRSWHEIEENKTYGLRSVAYKAIVSRKVKGTLYDEFDFDERDDVLIVFRVVEFVPEKSVTLVWKELRKEKAPKVIFPKKSK